MWLRSSVWSLGRSAWPSSGRTLTTMPGVIGARTGAGWGQAMVRRGGQGWGMTLDMWRSLFIQTEGTPNPNALKFLPGVAVTDNPNKTYDFRSAKAASQSPFARSLLRIPGVTGVFLGHNFVSVTKSPEHDWSTLKPFIFHEMVDQFSTDQPLILERETATPDSSAAASSSSAPSSSSSSSSSSASTGDGAAAATTSEGTSELTTEEATQQEIEAMILELLDTRIRPSVQSDGGDVEFVKFEEGIVYLKLQGSCSSCPSSSITLKSGIERTIMHWVPEVLGCVQVEENYYEDQMPTKNEEATA